MQIRRPRKCIWVASFEPSPMTPRLDRLQENLIKTYSTFNTNYLPYLHELWQDICNGNPECRFWCKTEWNFIWITHPLKSIFKTPLWLLCLKKLLHKPYMTHSDTRQFRLGVTKNVFKEQSEKLSRNYHQILPLILGCKQHSYSFKQQHKYSLTPTYSFILDHLLFKREFLQKLPLTLLHSEQP